MNRNISIRHFEKNDPGAPLAVFNSFVGDSFAAYCESELTGEPFEKRPAQAGITLTLRDLEAIIGFGGF